MIGSTLDEEKVSIIKERLARIAQGLQSDSQAKIARDFNVSIKSISRIAHGETWKHVAPRTEIPAKFLDMAAHFAKFPDEAALPSVDPTLIQSYNGLVTFKKSFCFDASKPLHWGWYEDRDGNKGILTDGVFVLIDTVGELIKYVLLNNTDADPDAKEIPTFRLSEIMTEPLGKPLTYETELSSGPVVLVAPDGERMVIAKKFWTFAHQRRYKFHAAGERKDFIYMTQFFRKNLTIKAHELTADLCDAMAAVAVMRENPC